MKKQLSRCYWWVLKKIEEPLIYGFMLIGVAWVVQFSFGVFVEYVNYKYGNKTITIVNEAVGRDEIGIESESVEDIPEAERVVSVDERIREIATSREFSEVERLIKVAKCEGGLKPECEILNHPACVNPTNNSFDRGHYQWSRKHNPKISDECAFDLRCATEAVIDDVEKYGWGKWSASIGCWGNQ